MERSICLAEAVYEATGRFPVTERYGLTAQLRKSAVSVASNVAEGQGRITSGEWLQFLGQARGSLFEVQTQLTIAERLGFLSRAYAGEVLAQSEVVGRGLAGLMNFVRTQSRRRR